MRITVIDSQQEAMVGALVSLERAVGKTKTAVVLTDRQGVAVFAQTSSSGTYILRVESGGFETFIQKVDLLILRLSSKL